MPRTARNPAFYPVTREPVRPQDVAERKLAQARRKVAEKTAALARLATQLHEWERKATRWAKLASMTDAEVEAKKVRRKQARENGLARRSRRAIELGGIR